MEVLVRIQAHPSRKDLRPALLESLKPLYVEVSEHSSVPPNPWLGYKQALSNLPDCSHVLVIQDDALPCKNFAPALEQVAASNPENPVCLFLGAYPAHTAAKARRAWMKKERYVYLNSTSFVPLVACLWPKRKAEGLLRWAQKAKITRADDGNAAKWMRATSQLVRVTVPSLVQHNDYVPSVKGGRQHSPGKESWRQAVLLAEDGLDYKW